MVSPTPETTPFLKQLVSSDRKARDSAVDSLRTYLTCGKSFTELELLKLWRGLFFCMWHSDRPATQQQLSRTLASLVSPLSESLFLQWIAAFWTTIVTNYASIDSLRLDKFLYLIRCYVNAGFSYLRGKKWDGALLGSYVDVIRGVLCERAGKVSDGLRYHLLDTWVEELEVVDEDGEAPVEEVLGVVGEVVAEGGTKVLREYAKGVLQRASEEGDGDGGQGDVEE